MSDFGVNEMLSMQHRLHEKYEGYWAELKPETGKDQLLWMIGEIGEVIDIVKKNGGDAAASDPQLRAHLVEELADVLMYYSDVLICYGVTADELKASYTKKFERNLTRW